MKTYSDYLREELSNYAGSYDPFIKHVPDLFELLCALLDEESLTTAERRLVNSALAYFVLPNDVISEELHGPMGYVDDCYVCCIVLQKLSRTHETLINSNWTGEEEFAAVLDTCTSSSRTLLEEENLTDTVVAYVGLEEIA